MTIRNEVKELSQTLAKLGLEQVLQEDSLADESFKVVYVNKQVQHLVEKPVKHHQKDDNTSL